MQKKMIAAALAALFVAPLALADVTFYGVMSGSLESASATGGSVDRAAFTRVADNNSRIGFKGSEDLGNGLQSIWQVENSLKYFNQGGTNDAGQTATFATRNTFVGLNSASVGTFLMGNYDSAYKRLTNGGVNVMSDTAADIDGTSKNVAGIFSRGEARLTNSIHYTTPAWAGFQAGISYGLDEGTVSGSSEPSKRNHLSLAGQYALGTLQIGAGWDHTANTGGYLGVLGGTTGLVYNPDGSVNFSKLVASYTFSTGTYVGAGVEYGSYSNQGAASMGQTGWTLAAMQSIGQASIRASYSRLGALSNTANPDGYKANEWVLGAAYNLSKSTQLLAYYARISNNALSNVDFDNTPLYTSGVGSSSAALATGERLSDVGLGMKIMF